MSTHCFIGKGTGASLQNPAFQIQLTFIECLLHAGNYAKHCIYIILFNSNKILLGRSGYSCSRSILLVANHPPAPVCTVFSVDLTLLLFWKFPSLSFGGSSFLVSRLESPASSLTMMYSLILVGYSLSYLTKNTSVWKCLYSTLIIKEDILARYRIQCRKYFSSMI